MKKSSGLDIMNQAAKVVEAKMKKKGKKLSVEGVPNDEDAEREAEESADGEALPAKKKSSKQVAAMREKMQKLNG